MADIIIIVDMQDDYTTERMRMVENQLKARDVTDPLVLKAMREVKRHLFIPQKNRYLAYSDQAVSIGYRQTISQPYLVGFTLQCLELKEGDTILEVGSGSGYVAALLAEIVGKVVAIEIVENLAIDAKSLLDHFGYQNVTLIHGDGFNGCEEYAPYDGIIVSAAAEKIPPRLLSQLGPNGRLIMPLGLQNGIQTLTLVQNKNGELSYTDLDQVRYVPLTREKTD